MSEHSEQVALFDFLSRMEGRYPALRWAFHPANEASGGGKKRAVAYQRKDGTQGYRAVPIEAFINAQMGVKAGVPDVVFPCPYYDPQANIAYPGCVIELKHGKGATTPEQDEWLTHFKRCGWYTAVFHNWTLAARLLLRWVGADERDVEGL